MSNASDTNPGTLPNQLVETTGAGAELFDTKRAAEVRSGVAKLIAKATAEDPRRGLALLIRSYSPSTSYEDALGINELDKISLLNAAFCTLNGSGKHNFATFFDNLPRMPLAETRPIIEAEGLDSVVRGFVARRTQVSWEEASGLIADNRLGYPIRNMLVSDMPEIPLAEALLILENRAIDLNVRVSVARRIQHMSLERSDVRKFFQSHSLDKEILQAAATRVSPLSFDQIVGFIQAKKARYDVEQALLGRVMSFPFSTKSAAFLADGQITDRLRERAAMEMEPVSLVDIAEYLRDTEVPDDSKKWVLWHLQETSFAEALPLLRDESISVRTRDLLASRLSRPSFTEVKDFITDAAVHVQVRECMVEQMSSVGFSEAVEVLADPTVDRSIRMCLAKRISDADPMDIRRFVADAEVDTGLRQLVEYRFPVSTATVLMAGAQDLLQRIRPAA